MKQIGKGLFTKCYLVDGEKKVTLLSYDPAKECIAHGWMGSSRLFPRMELVSNDYFPMNEYKMKYYPKVKSLKSSLVGSDYEMYQELRKIYRNSLNFSPMDGYNFWYKIFETKIKNKRLKKAMLDALEGLSNFGYDICFEISPRNVSVSRTGRLVLLDCFFFYSKLQQAKVKPFEFRK